MPASLPHTHETEIPLTPGNGGRPPLDRRHTGGGGGGGGDDESQSQSRGPRDLLLRVRTGLFLALSLEFSVLLLVATALMASHSNTGVRGGLGGKQLLMADLLLLLLGTTTWTAEMARRHIFREIDVLEEWLGLGKPALNRALPWLGAALLCGSSLLFCVTSLGHTAQGLALPLLMVGSLFVIHLLLGCVALFLCLVGVRWLRRVELRQVAIDATAWYWHSLAIMGAVLLLVMHFGA